MRRLKKNNAVARARLLVLLLLAISVLIACYVAMNYFCNGWQVTSNGAVASAFGLWTAIFGMAATRKYERFLRDESGQDLIEYALMAGFVAVVAGALMPHITEVLAMVVGNRLHATAASSGILVCVRLVCAAAAIVILIIIIRRRRRLDG
jgi:Flp pilus assembly pilin Flp